MGAENVVVTPVEFSGSLTLPDGKPMTPDYGMRIVFDGEQYFWPYRVFVCTAAVSPGVWEYAVLHYGATGLDVISYGRDYGASSDLSSARVAEIIGEYISAGGSSRDHIPASCFYLAGRGGSAHHRRPGGRRAYCGKSVVRRVDWKAKRGQAGYAEFHCVECTDAYRQEEFGRMPLSHGDDDTLVCGHVPDDECDCAMVAAESAG